MVTTQLPTKSEYDHAVNELKKLNEDLFYDDFKGKIKDLESNLELLALNNANDFKKEAENVTSRASMLFRQIESQQKEIRGLLEANQSGIIQNNQKFLEDERTRLLFVYDELQKSISLFSEKTTKLQQDVEMTNRYLVEQAVGAVETVSDNVKEFAQKLSVSDERNKEFLEQNEAFVTLTKENLVETEQKLTAHVTTLQQMDDRLERLLKSYEEMFHTQIENLKSILTIREEALINKVTHQLQNWTTKQSDLDAEHKLEILQWYEKVEAILKRQSDQNKEMLESISKKMSSKDDLSNVEKKSALKLNILLSVVAIEAILIGIKFFM